MAELDDARTLVPLAAADLTPEDILVVFHSASNTARGVLAINFRNATEGTPVLAVAASKTLSYGDTPANEDTIEITDGVTTETYQFLDTPVLPTDIQTEVSVTDALANAEAIISALSVLVNAEEATADLILTAITPGVAGNSISVAANTATGDGSLAGGIDATTAKKGEELFDADYRYLAVADVTVSSTSGWKTSPLTAL